MIDKKAHKNISEDTKLYVESLHRGLICFDPLPEKLIIEKLRQLAKIAKSESLEGYQISDIIWYLQENILEHFKKTACFYFDEYETKQENRLLLARLEKESKVNNNLCSYINKKKWSFM